VPSHFNGNISRDLARIRLNDMNLPEFWFQMLQSETAQKKLDIATVGTTRLELSIGILKQIRMPRPPLDEQQVIAKILSDMDGLIVALDKLIAKKRAIKQAAMQQLLTGKTRLPGFSGEWDVARIEEHASIKTGAKNTQDREDDGEYPFFVRSQVVERINTFSYDGEAVLTAGDGVGTGKVFHYINGRFDVHQRVYRIAEFSDRFHGRYFFYQFSSRFYDRIMSMTAKSSVDSVRMEMIAGMQIPLPSPKEQRAIATVLSDMDAEIAALERRRDKTKQIKQGMMQALLTGRVRLVKPEAPAVVPKAAPKRGEAHNWQFNEAVVISVLARQFGSEMYPLGRKRYTKLLYLLHRHLEEQVEDYLKKAAGPYNPKTKYGGPEKIAVRNGYVREHVRGEYRGFVAADSIGQAEGYFDKWYGVETSKWLEQFRFNSNDELELLATVDMAAEELRGQGAEITVAAVKKVIKADKQWRAKLSRETFSDEAIAQAIETCGALFGRPGGAA